jgi:leader peptidase (prepilin peptidase)/N-methyltransferase
MLDPKLWAGLPFHFWSVVLFVFGAVVGSFLNVCVHRMPRGLSLWWPPSHCPNCKYSIPWYRNVPLLTWLALRGKCANCRAPISARYFIVELLTGVLFVLTWIIVGRQSPAMALVYCFFIAGLIVATFIDFEHFIIPDEITIGGVLVGVVLSVIVPDLHGTTSRIGALKQSALGAAVGFGMVYAILRIGKLLFGRQNVQLEPNTRVVFTETCLVLPGQQVPFDDIFYRKSDAIQFEASTLELIDRCYKAVSVRLTPSKLHIGGEVLNPEDVHHMEVVTDRMVLPREAMGFGDVKFMAAIGAFLGWKATIFSLLSSSMIGAFVGLLLIVLKKQEWSSKIPYGPYIALGALLWILGGRDLVTWWFDWRFGAFSRLY